MTAKPVKDQTEADLESAISSAITLAFPRLSRSDIAHQIEFSIRLGHATITAKGRESWVRRGRADILLTFKGSPLAILELKKLGVSLVQVDGEQGMSYARLLPVMAPFVVVTNGKEVRVLETFTGKPFVAETPTEREFEDLMRSAAKVAASDREEAIATLMGSDPQVWTAATRAASEIGIAELTVTPERPLRPFGPLRIPRLATLEVGRKLVGGARLVLVSGAPLAGKTNVLGQLTRILKPEMAGALFLEGGASGVFRRLADLLSDALEWPIDPEQARAWVRRLSRAEGPMLILAIDRLDPEDRDDVRMIEDLTSNSFGPALKIVVGLDEDASRRVLLSSDGRSESAIGRRAALVEVHDLNDPEFKWALDALLGIKMGVMEGGQYSPDLRQPWLLQAFATRLAQIQVAGIGVIPAVPGREIIEQARANFADPELRRRYRDLAIAIAEDARDQSKPFSLALQLTGRYFVRRTTLDRVLQQADAEWLLRHAYLTPSISAENIPIVTIALPELLASELARHLADQLAKMWGEGASAAAEWLAGAASNFLFGDLVAAQAVFDLGAAKRGVPFDLYEALIRMSPVREATHAGQTLLAWVEGVGSVEIRPQEDGTTILTVGGRDHAVETDGEDGVSYANVHGWLVLAHLAARPFTIEVEGEQRRFDPQVLLVVGTADFVLRQPRNDILMDSLPVHDVEGGGQLVCHRAGVVETVTQSILAYLNDAQPADRDEFIAAVVEIDSLHLSARVEIALRTLTRSANEAKSEWAQATLQDIIAPAVREHFPDH